MMNMQLAINNLNYPICRKNNHHQELSQVCTDKRCQTNSLICPICEQTDHKGHRTIPLKHFLKQINIIDDQNATKQIFDLQFHFNQLQQKFKQHLVQLRQKFLNQLYEVQTKITIFFNLLCEKYQQTFHKHSASHITQIIANFACLQKVNALQNLINDLKNYNQTSFSEQLLFYKTFAERKYEVFIENGDKVLLDCSFKKTKKSLQPPSLPFNDYFYSWSNFKAPSITINGNVATQKASNHGAQRFALVQSKSLSCTDIKVKFKISKLKGWIGIGICLKQKIIKAGYKFNYTQLEHGSYLISANGYSWSHSRPEYNSAYKSFIFHEGDIISVQYNMLQRKASFESKLNGSKFYLSTVDCPSDDIYVPCVNLCNIGDEVEIFNDID